MVLILVLVEDGLREYFRVSDDQKNFVLILVLVEDGLRAWVKSLMYQGGNRLNPCSCGGWSQSREIHRYQEDGQQVLILVLVEDGLREQ